MVWHKDHDAADLDEKLHQLRQDPFDMNADQVKLADDYVVALEARGIWKSMQLYASRELTDGVILPEVVPMIAANAGVYTHRCMAAIDALVRVKLIKKRTKRQGNGWVIVNFLKYNPTKEQVTRKKGATDALRWLQDTAAGRKVRDMIRERDGDRCRYCYIKLNYNDHASPLGGTYDHVYPLDDERKRDPQWIVCACKFHNGMKQDRTPEEANLTLLSPWPVSTDGQQHYANLLQEASLRVIATNPEHASDTNATVTAVTEIMNTSSEATSKPVEPVASQRPPSHNRVTTSGRDGLGRVGSGRQAHSPPEPPTGSTRASPPPEIHDLNDLDSIPHPAEQEDLFQ